MVAASQAPRAIGPYSQAVISGDLPFTFGQLPIHPATERMVCGGIAEQAHQVFKNIEATAKAAGVIIQHTKKTNVFLPDINDYKVVNEINQAHFTSIFIARSAFQAAALSRAGKIDVEAVTNTKTMS